MYVQFKIDNILKYNYDVLDFKKLVKKFNKIKICLLLYMYNIYF